MCPRSVLCYYSRTRRWSPVRNSSLTWNTRRIRCTRRAWTRFVPFFFYLQVISSWDSYIIRPLRYSATSCSPWFSTQRCSQRHRKKSTPLWALIACQLLVTGRPYHTVSITYPESPCCWDDIVFSWLHLKWDFAMGRTSSDEYAFHQCLQDFCI